MSPRVLWGSIGAVVLGASLGVAACGGEETVVKPPPAPGGSNDQSKWPADDRSMCDWKNKPELEVSESSGPGAMRPNVRRVYKMVGEGDSRTKVIVCREIDTNLDGIKDVVRTFDAKGDPQHEEADRDYDGRIDVWMNFIDGKVVEEDVDSNRDGKPDVWKFYTDGQVQRIRRDTNGDGKPDVWEIYAKGRLERMGTDETFDGHVDRWDRDEQLKQEAEAAEAKAREQMEAQARDAGTAPPERTGDAGAGDGGGGSKGGGAGAKDAGAPGSKKDATSGAGGKPATPKK